MGIHFWTVPLLAAVCQGAVIYQSATFTGGGASGGTAVSPEQFVGARFSIGQPAEVTAIGGDLSLPVGGTLFGAILSLRSLDALPSGHPFDQSTIAAVVFTAPPRSEDLKIPLTAQLDAGAYAIVFGSGEFGSRGEGVLSTEDRALPGANTILWNRQHVPGPLAWVDAGSPQTGSLYSRVVVYGAAVPEPTTFCLVALIIPALFVWTRRSRYTP